MGRGVFVIFELALLLAGLLPKSPMSCDVDEPISHEEDSICAPLSNSFDEKQFKEILKDVSAAAHQSKSEAFNFTCRDDSLNFNTLPSESDSNSEPAEQPKQFIKAMKMPSNVYEIAGTKANDQKDPLIHLLGENNQVGRYDPSSDKIEWAKLPEGVQADKTAKFSESGKFLEISASTSSEGSVSVSTKISLDDLFKKTDQLVDLNPSDQNILSRRKNEASALELGDANASNEFKVIPTTTNSEFKDLIVENPEGEIVRFPYEDSEPVQLDGIEKLGSDSQTFVSKNAKLAFTVEPKETGGSEARIWKSSRIAEAIVNQVQPNQNLSNEKIVANQDGAKTGSLNSASSLLLGEGGLGAPSANQKASQLLDKLLNPDSVDAELHSTDSNLVADAGEKSEASTASNADALATMISKTNETAEKMGLKNSGKKLAPQSLGLEPSSENELMKAIPVEPQSFGFHIENGILVANHKNLSQNDSTSETKQDESTQSTENPINSLHFIEWILVLPTRPWLTRKRDFGQTA